MLFGERERVELRQKRRKRGSERDGDSSEKLTFLLNYAVLAPSSHNSQPWKFNVSGDEISLFADKTRWLKVADADQRELHISLGCAQVAFVGPCLIFRTNGVSELH